MAATIHYWWSSWYEHHRHSGERVFKATSNDLLRE